MSPLKLLTVAIGVSLGLGAPIQLAAQAGVVFEGRVVDGASGSAVVNATVSLDGAGSTLSNANGGFRFDDVEPGTYSLIVSAFGYVEVFRTVVIAGGEFVTVSVDPAPLLLDSIRVEAATIDFDGLVRDGRREVNLYDAQILTSQGHREVSNWHGRFDLDDVYEEVPIRVVIRAFGYLPLDTTFVPTDDGRQTFDMMPDELAERMIQIQIDRLDARRNEEGHGYREPYVTPVIDRDDLSRFVMRGTLQTVMEATYPLNILRRVGCTMVDERPVASRAERTLLLQTLLPQQLERVELLEFPREHGALMLRIYTRRFFQELVATNRELPTPTMVGMTRICR